MEVVVETAGPIKIRIFLWRLAKSSIPSGAVLHRQNMATSPACSLCGVHDSWRHALLDCPMSRSTWALSTESILDQLSINQNECAKEWIFAMGKALSPEEFVRFVTTLWASGGRGARRYMKISSKVRLQFMVLLTHIWGSSMLYLRRASPMGLRSLGGRDG